MMGLTKFLELFVKKGHKLKFRKFAGACQVLISYNCRYLRNIVNHFYYCIITEAPEFVDIAAQYGELDFVINSTRHHSSSWQRCHGDPHGQVAPQEFPDPRADDTLSFDFPTPEERELDLVLWQHRFNS